MTRYHDDDNDDEKQVRRERFQRRRSRLEDDHSDVFRRNKTPYKRSKIEHNQPIDEFDEWLDE